MPENNESTMKWRVDITQLKAAMQDAKRSISLANAEFKAATAGMDKWQSSTTGLEAKLKQLNATLPQQKSILQQLEQQYAIVAENLGENSAEAQRLKIQIENQKGAINKTEAAISSYEGKLSDLEASENSLTKTISRQEAELANLKTAYVDAVGQYGANSKEAQNLAKQISDLSGELADNKAKQDAASSAANKLDQSMDNVDDTVDDTTEDVKELDGGFTILKGTMANLAADAIKGLINGFVQLGKALVDTGKQAIMSYADYEQLVGGVETLFGTGGQSIHEYAASVGKTVEEVSDEYYKMQTAQKTVLDNASVAFREAGMSQNQYMETVTSFSASLIQSLEGDTQQAADLANQAIIDMSDNANKMGSDISTLQSAYAGFAKGQYTLLDNLKLGYGGTKTEMERLIADANELAKANGEAGDLTIESYADIIKAIHLVQDNMGITGTTAKEAASTISGSMGMAQSAWSNFLTGMADDNADFEQLTEDLVSSIVTVAQNLIPRIKTIAGGLGSMLSGLIEALLPVIVEEMPTLINDILGAIVSNLPLIMQAGMTLLQGILSGIMSALPQLLSYVPILIQDLCSFITANLPTIVSAGFQILLELVNGIMSALPMLLQQLPILINTIVTIVMDNLPLILEAGMQILMGLVDGLLAALPELISMLPTILDTILTTLTDSLPMILDMGMDILMSLIDGLLNAIPQLIEMLPTLITTIVNTLTTNLPKILKMGIKILVKLIDGLGDAIPQLISMLPTIISTIVTTLVENLPAILQMGKDILGELISGLGSMLSSLGTAAGKIFTKIWDVVKNIPQRMLTVGKNLVQGIWSGITNSLQWIKDKISEWVGNVVDFIKGLFGIHSPSKVMADEVGKWLPEGMAEGFAKDMPKAVSAMKKSLNGAVSGLKADAIISANGILGNGAVPIAGGQIVTFNQTINSPKAVDGMTLYRETNNLLFGAKVRLGNV